MSQAPLEPSLRHASKKPLHSSLAQHCCPSCPMSLREHLPADRWAVPHQNTTVGPSLETWLSHQPLISCPEIPFHCYSKHLLREPPAQPFCRTPCYAGFSQLQTSSKDRVLLFHPPSLCLPSITQSPWHTLIPERASLSLPVSPVGILSDPFQNRYLVCRPTWPWQNSCFSKF